MPGHVLDIAKRRKTVREFSHRPVGLGEVLTALEAACQAPSGANSQPWRFVIITDSDIKKKIRKECEIAERKFYSEVTGELREWLLERGFSWRKPFLEEAPMLILILSETEAPYSTQSVWLAIGYILLVLEESGLGTVTYTPTNLTEVLREIGVPERFKLEAILPVGAADDERAKEPRLGMRKVTYVNAWGQHLQLPLK